MSLMSVDEPPIISSSGIPNPLSKSSCMIAPRSAGLQPRVRRTGRSALQHENGCRRALSLTNLGARVKRAPQKALLPGPRGLPAAIKIQHRFDRAPAHRAKRHVVAANTDAVGLGPEVSSSLVI